jgi:uncharacterized protein (TIGR01777 family)
MLRVTVTGATGMIGGAVVRALRDRGGQVAALTRSAQRGRAVLGAGVELHEWPDPHDTPPPPASLEDADAVINLLGEPIAQRWSEQAKREIRDSRVLGTRSLVAGLASLPDDRRPRVLVSQSATGYYGAHGDEPLDERAGGGEDFLAGVTSAWEQAAFAAPSGVRVVLARTGVVLSPHGGALARMLTPFKLGVGGPVAGGRQYVPWIHLDDVAGAILHCAGDDRASGPVNVTAPNPVANVELSRTLGRVLNRPAVLPVPGALLRALYGEMASIVITGQRVVPRRLTELGYSFAHSELEGALRDVLGR